MTDFVMLPIPTKDLAPTVAEALPILQERGWRFDIKWDGVRAVLNTRTGALTNRNGRDIAYRYPELRSLTRDLPDCVLDGEIIVCGEDAMPSFSQIAQRDALESSRRIDLAAKASPAVFVVFDCLELHGDDLRARPLDERLVALADIVKPGVLPHLIPSMSSTDATAMWAGAGTLGLEGLIAKDPASSWTSGRSSSWVKLKKSRSITALVRSYKGGSGSLEGGLGALVLELQDNEDWSEVGHVGTGMSQQQRKDYQRTLDGGGHLLVEVDFMELTDAGRLRFPALRGLRTDLTTEACQLSQIRESVTN